MDLPLDGFRVIEMSHMIMGPSCGMFLAQLGAEVIKVEPPAGDKTRYLTGMGTGFFPVFNRGKRSVVLDLQTEAGREAMQRLIASADIFIENFRDRALERVGLGHKTLRERYPALIIAAHKGFLSGPYEHRPALDEVVQMMTGLAYMTGPRGRPLRVGSSANDIMGGMHGTMSIMGALLQRARSGKGKLIRIGLFENCLLMVAQHMVHFELTGEQAPPMPNRDFSWPVYDIFDAADGEQVFVSVVTETQWGPFCDAFELDELIGHVELADQLSRIHARSWTIPLIAKALVQYTAQDLMEKLEALGLPYSPINRPADLYTDPHVLRPHGLLTSKMPDGRTFRTPAMPVEYDGVVPEGPADVPALGADTHAVLSALGYADEEIAKLA
ncbi:MAG: crotonobetainyl-CoA:carnitine CoA-transferase CaiB-like acyl-CoA transferase [Gammaproteobacteria bacterium]|jgi:crotonobetainyl-CoA:carnitine CoA-transferase CaiB-like acyl-CoA transferase